MEVESKHVVWAIVAIIALIIGQELGSAYLNTKNCGCTGCKSCATAEAK